MGTVLYDARRLLRMTQREFAEAAGVSHRTAVRWDAEQSIPSKHAWISLAEHIVQLDPALAAEIAELAGETLETLGLALPPPPSANLPEPGAEAEVEGEPPSFPPSLPEPTLEPEPEREPVRPPPPPDTLAPSPPPLPSAPPSPPPMPPVPPEHLVDAVVCAVAEFLDTSPRTLRPLLYTAFRKARQVGLSVEDVEKALAPDASVTMGGDPPCHLPRAITPAGAPPPPPEK